MKKALFLFFISLALVSCSDKKNDPKPEVTIVGKWKQLSFTELEYVDGKPVDNPLVVNYTDDDVDAVEFKADGTMIFIAYHDYIDTVVEDKGSYSIKGNKIFVLNSDNEMDEGEFSIEGDTLTVIAKESETDKGVIHYWDNISVFKKTS